MEPSPTPSHSRSGTVLLAGILLVLVFATWLAVHWDLDRRFSARFFHPETGWFLAHAQPWKALYRSGPHLGLGLALAGFGGLILGSLRQKWRPWRRPCLVVVLTAAIGAGLLVNAVLKPYWGRPRPRDTVTFGGVWEYRHPHQPGTPGRGKSFPCGHCTMGYLFTALFVLRQRAPRLAPAAVAFGFLYGTLTGFGRMVQGAHFATDVLWSLGIMALVAVGLEYFLLPAAIRFWEGRKALGPLGRWVPVIGTTLLAGMLAAGLLTRRPFFETYHLPLSLKPGCRIVKIDADTEFSQRRIRYDSGPGGHLRVDLKGTGWIHARLKARLALQNPAHDTLRIEYRLLSRGTFSEIDQRLEIVLPAELEDRVEVRFQGD